MSRIGDYPYSYDLARSSTQHEALKQLLRVALSAPEDRLHMNVVVDRAAECGTARCLAGWCIVDDWMRAHTEFGNIRRNWAKHSLPSYGHDLASTFGITPAQATKLFWLNASIHDRRYAHAVSKQSVVRRIRRLLRGQDITSYKIKRAA